MTRRYLAYKVTGGYKLSQEFNGDRSEHLRFCFDSPITMNWSDVVSLFQGATNSLHGFAEAVKKAEDGYTYKHLPLETVNELPEWYEIWVFQGGQLHLKEDENK